MSPLFGRKRATPRLSVVVPVYNVEPYVAECFDSLLGQEFQDFEVIVVDDGSTDGSAAVVERYLSGGSKFSMVHSNNHGPGAARNHGVGLAWGELLAFVDSDDTLPPYAYALMVAGGAPGGDAQRLRMEQGVPAVVLRAGRPRLPGGCPLRGQRHDHRGVLARGGVRRGGATGLPVADPLRRQLDHPAAS